MMRRFVILLLCLLGYISASSQVQQINYGDLPKPVPSVSSVATNNEAPVSMATGIPDIRIPITEISSVDPQISARLTLSYNPYNIHDDEYISHVGLGWDLFSGGVITRTIVNDLDERYDNETANDYTVNQFDDIYYYYLPTGISGKFRISRNNNNFSAINLEANNVRIEITKHSNPATLIINSFIIMDDKGYSYHFSDYSQSLYSPTGKLYRSAFYLSSIKNVKNAELLTYEYQKDNRLKEGTSQILYQSCKLKTIHSTGLGKINIEYAFDATLEKTMNDPYSISKITTQNNYGKLVSIYNFDYTFPLQLNPKKRILNGLNKSNLENLTGSPLERTAFEYQYGPDFSGYVPFESPCLGNPFYINPYPVNSAVGTLKKIIHPTGGATAYAYEPNEHYFDKNSPQYLESLTSYVDPYIQELQQSASFNYNTAGNANLIMWNIAGDPTKKKTFFIYFNAYRNPPGSGPGIDPGLPGTNLSANFKINGSIPAHCQYDMSPDHVNLTTQVELYPGNNIIEITGWNISGTFTILEVVNAATPYKNADYGKGVRIKNISHYKNSSDTVPEKTKTFSYTKFDSAHSSSGALFYNENIAGNSEYILYDNIRVTENSGNTGYIDYYFKTPKDYPDTYVTEGNQYVTVKNYYNLTQRGLPEKTLYYNASSEIVNSTETEYLIEPRFNKSVVVNGIRHRPGVIKKMTVTEKNHLNPSEYLENKTEAEFSNYHRNYQLEGITSISTDGDVYEKNLAYPSPLVLPGDPYEHLATANLIGIPLSVQEKRNGKLTSFTERKYDNNSLFPTSVVTHHAEDNSTTTNIRYDSHDNRGNVRQFTTMTDNNGVGFPTSIVYGYNASLPIAVIQGATLADLQWILYPVGQDIVTLSNNDVDEASEKLLMAGLDYYRNVPELKNFQVTTYTYDPLIGVTSITPPSGIREIYKYDANGKLKSVTDVNGNILQNYQYHLKPQP
ncbi:MAG: hypothetical protein ABS44_02890 [Chryseobacterium sp. SCN 40-13]|nr:MAG: hypothetical protein ABS44_02890 [Chryseobacterium sp. SCN 40-13]